MTGVCNGHERGSTCITAVCEKLGHKDLILLSGNYLGGVEPNKASCLSGLSQFRCRFVIWKAQGSYIIRHAGEI